MQKLHRTIRCKNKACCPCDYTTGQEQRRQQWSKWWTSGEIPTALTKLRLPMALARLAALRFFLVSFFRGRWCSFAQMGLSLERLTRPRNTIVTNFFIIPLPLFQKSKLTVTHPKVTAGSTSGACIAKELPTRLGLKNTLAVFVISGKEGAVRVRIKEREGEAAKESADISEWWGGVQTNPSTGNRSCARSCNTKDSS